VRAATKIDFVVMVIHRVPAAGCMGRFSGLFFQDQVPCAAIEPMPKNDRGRQ
jgi:hypothetical protein